MKLVRICLTAVLLSALACGQSIVRDWFPVHAGDRWIYQNETRDDIGEGREHLDVHRWTTEETTVGTWTVPEGTIVQRTVRVTEGAPGADWRQFHMNANPVYLIRGDGLYIDEVDWDASTHRLGPHVLKGLTTFLSPDFCFPLTARKTWGAPHGLPDCGVTRPEDAKDWQVKDRDRETFHIVNISGYRGSGITADIWFEKGVGVIREDDIHHGTIGEVRRRLVRFHPASQR